MTDLRTRIAAVLYRLWQERFPRSSPWEQLAADERESWLTDADVVIHELNLERQDHYDPHCDYYRYVTDWIAPND